jgi:hypothetical protein
MHTSFKMHTDNRSFTTRLGLVFGIGLVLEVTMARNVLPHPQGIKGNAEFAE